MVVTTDPMVEELVSGGDSPHSPTQFQYASLGEQEIRLLRILSGEFQDPVTIEIIHVVFDPNLAGESQSSEQPTLEELNADLPTGWIAEETADGRILFIDLRTEGKVCTSWNCPDASSGSVLVRGVLAEPRPAPEPSFEALSYVWGARRDAVSVAVRCTGEELDKLLHIQPSLAEAFKHLRYQDRDRVIWADAVCINQEDEKEKNAHIPNMWMIYGHAYRTVVWLGPEANNSRLAINRLQYIASQNVLLKDGLRFPAPDAEDPLLYRAFEDPLDAEGWAAIHDLLDRPYFERLWVVSELAMSSWRAELLCGSDTLALLDLRTAVLCLADLDTALPPGLRMLLRNVEGISYPSSYLPFNNLLESYRQYRCADARDKVYALLSLASSSLQRIIVVDYGMPIQHVYREVFLAVCEHYKRLDFIRDCHLDLKADDGPSWAPNLKSSYTYLRPNGFCSGFSQSEIVRLSLDVIQVTGVRCAVVSNVSDTFKEGARLLHVLRGWFCKVQSAVYGTDESTNDVFLKTIFHERTRERYDDPGPATLEEIAELLMPYLLDGTIELRKQDESNALLSYLEDMLEGRDFFQAIGGFFGLGPGITKPGDIVCAFLGCNDLMLLRPQENNQYQVVGNCFVHGFHDSTAFLGPLDPAWRVILPGDQYGGVQTRFRRHRALGSNFAEVAASDDLSGTESDEENVDEDGIEIEDTIHDPRLGDLPAGWEWKDVPRTKDKPDFFATFSNTLTGVEMNSDPRMLPNALQARGVTLETFELV